MLRYWFKEVYIIMVRFLMLFVQNRNINTKQIVVLMTFKEDTLPVIQKLNERGFHVTVFANRQHLEALKQIDGVIIHELHQMNICHQLYTMAGAKVIIIDNLYAFMAGFKKKKGQTVIQTWHAAGALKQFGFEDHAVNQDNVLSVKQYQKVYATTDKYLVGCAQMATCFQNAFHANYEQLVNFGVPRMSRYFQTDTDARKSQLRAQLGIERKVAVYLPTYREEGMTNRILNKEAFEKNMPDYLLLTRYHPATHILSEDYGLSIFDLVVLADVIISDYSSLPIEASLIQTPTLFYVYDEQAYEKVRGLNRYFYDIPTSYKVYREEDIYRRLESEDLQPLFEEWHTYNKQSTLNQIAIYVDRLTKI